MANPRKPANVLQLSGAKRRNPARYKNRGKQPVDKRGIGNVPSDLTDAQKAAWHELVKNDPGVLLRSDRIAVECTARLMAQIRSGDNATAAAQTVLISMLGKLGQTPQSRSSLSIPEPKTRSIYDDD
jgi:hypothetical protein